MYSKCLIWCLVAIFSLGCGLEEVPEYIHVCPENDRTVQCIIESLEHLRPYLVQGIPELDIPSVDPLQLGDLLISGNSASKGLTITAKDILTYGPSNFKVKKLNIVRYGEEYHFDVILPHIYVEGDYNINGQILLLPIRGSGEFRGNFTSCTGTVKAVLAKHSSIDEHVKVSKIDIKIKVGNGNLELRNLFNGDKTLGETINNVINQNFEIINNDLVPLVEKALQRTFKKLGNKICNRYAYSQLFP